jgi:catechol 2,3-dioxygenase-like lactoylglutathione lyase family enzyme
VSSGDLVIQRAVLPVSARAVPALRDFYRGWGEVVEEAGGGFSLGFGSGRVAFLPVPGRPFHHFALLVPGDRFVAARTWLASRAPLAAEPGSSETTFDFDDWNALAVYVIDPAGNIVELIGHAELSRSGRTGPFDPGELAGISEVGLVVEDRAAALAKLAERGIELWAGSAGPDGLSFVGRKAHTLILVSPGRGWLPTGAPAVASPARVEIGVGGDEVAVTVAAGAVRVLSDGEHG